ncbi:hypothetical protein TrRE_jg11968 [Triparma retinervis]|uniref:Uncharacterized protein n=1 Tax=Triparma retinervis TaxID=2557542 RepID=A0A9W7AFX9_9STRA|nr:hypothetical protein TrRE_jg11968 [Triparma retinervis]
MSGTTLRERRGGNADPVAVSFSELFFDLALVSSTARLSEYVRHGEEVHFDLRFVSCLFSFWYIWHSTNLQYNFTSAASTSPFRNITLFIKLAAVLTMSSSVKESPTLSDDIRFMRSYVVARMVDACVYARLHRLARRDGFASSVCNGLVANGVSNILESIIWAACSATVTSTEGMVKAMFGAQVFSYVGLRTITQKIWRQTSGEEEEGGGKKVSFDFKHFRERQGLLIILVLGEAIMSSVLTEEEVNDGTTLFQQYAVSFSCALIAFLLKILYIDSPLIDEWQEVVSALVPPSSLLRSRPPSPSELLGFVAFAPLHAVVLALTTCTAAAFKLVLDSGEADAGGKGLLMASLGGSIMAVGMCKSVKYDVPALDKFEEASGVDLRIVAELATGCLLVVLGQLADDFRRVSCIVCALGLLLSLVLFEYGYCRWTIGRLERLKEVKEMGALDESLLTKA